MNPYPIWSDDLPPRWREAARLVDLWQAYYMARGVARFRAFGIARKKAAKGKRPPLHVVQ